MQTPTVGAARPRPAPVASRPVLWPATLNLSLATAALGVAVFRQPLWSAVAYGVVLVLGAVLVAVQRRLAIAAIRPTPQRHSPTNPWARGTVPMTTLEKAAVVAMMVTAVLNALVVALEIGRWAWVQ